MVKAPLLTLDEAIRTGVPLYYRGSHSAAWGRAVQVGACPCGCGRLTAYVMGEYYEGLARHVRPCHLRTAADVILTACEREGCGCRDLVGVERVPLTLAELAKAMQDQQ